LQKIKLTEVKPGMILAQPIENNKGLTLAAPGTEVTDRLMMRFENMGIEFIWVEVKEQFDAAKAQHLREAVMKRFEVAGDAEVWKDLQDILLERIEQKAK